MNYASASTCLCSSRRDNPVGAERVGIGALVSAVWDDGPTDRHRDHTSGALAPLAGVQLDQASDVDRSHWV